MDEDLKRSRGKPGPGHYAPNKDKKVPGHVEMCLDRISFLDEAIRDKIESVGPGFYKPKVRQENSNNNIERYSIGSSTHWIIMENTQESRLEY